MKRLWLFLYCVGFIACWVQGCANVQKPEEIAADTKPVVSKTIAEAPARSLKRVVAIARFSNETKYGQNFFQDQNGDWVGKQASDILAARLTESDKFIMLERTDLDKINSELKLGNIGSLKIPADYLIIGSVSEFGRKSDSNVGFLNRTKKQTAYAKVNVRLIDIRTGQIVFAQEGAGEAFVEAGTVMGMGKRADYDSTLNDKAISAAISKLVSNVMEKLLDKPWRSYILSYESGSYFIAGGKSQGIRTGDVFTVYERGNTVKNPQTGMSIELPGKPIAKLRVMETIGSGPNEEMSLCVPEGGTLPNAQFANLYVQEGGK